MANHRAWMLRNFALTFAAVTLRIQLGVMTGGLGMSFDDAYACVAWTSWVPNLVLVEWFLALAPSARKASDTEVSVTPESAETTAQTGSA